MAVLATIKKLKKRSLKQQLNLDPKLHGADHPQTVFEGKERHAVITFVDANPPSEAHQHLGNAVRYHASKNGGEPRVYLSHKQTASNPLSYSQKFLYAKDVFGPDIVHHTPAEDLHGVLSSLHGKFDRVTVVGNDKLNPEWRRDLSKKNGKDYNFKSLHFVSIGSKDPDRNGPSKIRTAAKNNDGAKFGNLLPKQLQPHAEKMLPFVRKGMGIRESYDNEFQTFINNL